MAAKHLKICYQSGTGIYVVTEPRHWKTGNQVNFPSFDLINDLQNFEAIEGFLIEQRNFQRVDNA